MYSCIQFSIAKFDFEMKIVEEELFSEVYEFLENFIVPELEKTSCYHWELKLNPNLKYTHKHIVDDNCTLISEKWFARIDFKNHTIQSEISEIHSGYIYALICGVYFKIFKNFPTYLWCHACGVVKDNRGYIFTGVSGAGKTTIANRAKQYEVLSDETIILMIESSGITIYGTPFSSDDSLNKGLNKFEKLSSIFIISHGEKSEIKRISAGQAFSEIMKTNVTNQVSDFFFERAGELWSKVLTHIPCYKFKINIQDNIWEVIDNENI